MFTGLIKDIGIVVSVARSSQSAQLTIETVLTDQLSNGDSLAVNGVCLTVERKEHHNVTATAVAETLDRSSLAWLTRRARVNLEPALRAGDPMGGHVVQGHVDGMGTLLEARLRGVSYEVLVSFPEHLKRYVVEKGSIALDGVSLTIAELQEERLKVAVVPHTWENTALSERKAGDKINVEVDILAKYVERLLQFGAPSDGAGTLTEAYLREKGF
jgi:riboflavin synthase